MKGISGRILPVFAALTLSTLLAACAGESQVDPEGTGGSRQAIEAGEHAAPEGGAEGVSPEGSGERREGGEHGEAREGGEHAEGGEAGEHGEEGGHDEEGEESGAYVGVAETWDVVRRGARLVLSYDSGSRAFVGRVENTTQRTLCAVRVEVHLSNGAELGPTAELDLPAGQTTPVRLPSQGEPFEAWTAHPEISPCGAR